MLQVIINLLTLRALSTSAEAYVGVLAVWLLMLGAGFSSVFSRNWPVWLKLLWVLLLVGVPIVGMFFYCLLSLILADYSFLKLLGLNRKSSGEMMSKQSIKRAEKQS